MLLQYLLRSSVGQHTPHPPRPLVKYSVQPNSLIIPKRISYSLRLSLQLYDVEAQTHRVVQALSEALALAAHSLADLVKVNVYLVDAADIPAFNRAYAQHFDADAGPIRTMVVVKRLPHKDIRVEIEGIALVRH